MDIELVSETNDELKFEIIFDQSSFTTEEDVYEIKFPTSPSSPPFLIEKKNKKDQENQLNEVSTSITEACSSIMNTSDWVVNGEEFDRGEQRVENKDEATQVHIVNTMDRATQEHIEKEDKTTEVHNVNMKDTATQVHINQSREVVSLKLENIRLKRILELEANKLSPYNCKTEKTEQKFDWLKQDEKKFYFFTGKL